MIRVAAYLVGVLALVIGLHWLAMQPGTITIEWPGYRLDVSMRTGLLLLAGLVALILLAWAALRWIWRSPALVGQLLSRRRRQRGLDALTGGIIAVGAGDRALAQRYAAQARKALPHEPLTHLLRAQAAQASGDRATARRIFEAMLASPDTEQLGLRGLFLEAEREGEPVAARQFAQRALRLNPKLDWPVAALFDMHCRARDWPEALETLAVAERQRLVEKGEARRRRAVLLTAQAQGLEEEQPDQALALALEAHRLAPDLVPAAAIAGRILASRGKTPAAARVLLRAWRMGPHPELAVAYAYARPGDSPRDRLVRVRQLSRITPGHPEALIAIAASAIEARAWDEAREALKPLLDSGHLTVRVCALMARIEGEQYGDTGRVREWLARAVGAARDPAWIADGIVYEHWSPVSPATGRLDAMRWEVPDTGASERAAAAALAARLESMLGLAGSSAEPRLEATPAAPVAPAEPATQAAPPVVPAAIAPAPEPVPEAAPASGPASGSGPRLPAAPQAPAMPPQVPATTAATVEADETPLGEAVTPPVKPFVPDRTHPRPPVAEPRIFVPPRAPDDPGTDVPDLDDVPPYPTRA